MSFTSLFFFILYNLIVYVIYLSDKSIVIVCLFPPTLPNSDLITFVHSCDYLENVCSY